MMKVTALAKRFEIVVRIIGYIMILMGDGQDYLDAVTPLFYLSIIFFENYAAIISITYLFFTIFIDRYGVI